VDHDYKLHCMMQEIQLRVMIVSVACTRRAKYLCKA